MEKLYMWCEISYSSYSESYNYYFSFYKKANMLYLID